MSQGQEKSFFDRFIFYQLFATKNLLRRPFFFECGFTSIVIWYYRGIAEELQFFVYLQRIKCFSKNKFKTVSKIFKNDNQINLWFGEQKRRSMCLHMYKLFSWTCKEKLLLSLNLSISAPEIPCLNIRFTWNHKIAVNR